MSVAASAFDGLWADLVDVGRDPRTGVLFAAANSRGAQGYAAGR